MSDHAFLFPAVGNAEVAELADARDSKSRAPCGHEGSTPSFGTSLRQGFGWQAGVLAEAVRNSHHPLNHQISLYCQKAIGGGIEQAGATCQA
jgi:hypothetical protein